MPEPKVDASPSRDVQRPAATKPTAAVPTPVVPDAATPEQLPTPRHFPPANFEAPYAATAQPGDGEWSPVGAPNDRARASVSMVRSVVHPHAAARYVSVEIVALDLERLDIRFALGTKDVEGKKVPAGVPVGLVPVSEQSRLLAVFNGGFQEQHGHFAMGLQGFMVGHPRPDACAFVSTEVGAFKLATWARLEPTQSFRFFRQTPPCLLENGEFHAQLLKGNSKIWAGHNPNIVTRRRSALGVDSSGKVLFYAVGVEAEPLQLAQALKVAGAVAAAELDINWAWTKMVFFRDAADALEIGSALRGKWCMASQRT